MPAATGARGHDPWGSGLHRYPAAMPLQMTIFFDLDSLNTFLASNDWTVDDVTLTVHHATSTRGNSPFASDTGYEILESSFYLLHPRISPAPRGRSTADA
jgi:hypothetical protein